MGLKKWQRKNRIGRRTFWLQEFHFKSYQSSDMLSKKRVHEIRPGFTFLKYSQKQSCSDNIASLIRVEGNCLAVILVPDSFIVRLYCGVWFISLVPDKIKT
eukprot:sb/3478447/